MIIMNKTIRNGENGWNNRDKQKAWKKWVMVSMKTKDYPIWCQNVKTNGD